MKEVTNIRQLEVEIEKNGRLVIDKDGQKIIIMSMEEYQEKMLEKDLEEHLLKAEDDIENGREKDARAVFKEWQEKYGI